ncbi:MAG: metallophosphoesterase [Thermoplasmata archaeon]|nr:metallophosphoesterase [Thermoplasmata archaeon]
MSPNEPPSPFGVAGAGSMLKLTPEGADELIDRLEAEVPAHRGVVQMDPDGVTEALVIGDTHGDWRSTEAAARRFLEDPPHRMFVGLGDYVDRSPDDCGQGSVANILYLFGLAARFPDRVFLVRGNHELNRQIPVLPHDLPEELDTLWGPDPDRYARLNALLDRGPLAATTSSGIYFAHAGFLSDAAADWRARLDRPGEEELLWLTWAECHESRIQRGVPRFTTTDLEKFQAVSQTKLFLRGHDPDLNGQWACGDRCLTLHTSRVFERYGGVLVGRVDLTKPARRESVRLEHLETEGVEFDPP